MEGAFGHDFGAVRLHTDAQAVEAAQVVNARAFTVGRDIAFGAGQYAPALPEGRRLLAHELAHVIQQSRGGAPGAPAPHHDAAEVEARLVSQRAANGLPVAVSSQADPRRLYRQELQEADSFATEIRTLGACAVRPQSMVPVLLTKIEEFGYDLRNHSHIQEVAHVISSHLPPEVLILFLEHVELVNGPPKPGSGQAYEERLQRIGSRLPGLVIQPTLHAIGDTVITTQNRARVFGAGVIKGVEEGLSKKSEEQDESKTLDTEFLSKLRLKLLGSGILTGILPQPFLLGTAAGIAQEWKDTWELITHLREAEAALLEVVKKLFSPQGEDLATAMGYDAGLAFVNEIRTEVDKSLPRFSYWLGTKVGPALLDLALSLAGISVVAIVLKRSFSLIRASLNTFSDFAKWVKRAETVAPDLNLPSKTILPDGKPVGSAKVSKEAGVPEPRKESLAEQAPEPLRVPEEALPEQAPEPVAADPIVVPTKIERVPTPGVKPAEIVGEATKIQPVVEAPAPTVAGHQARPGVDPAQSENLSRDVGARPIRTRGGDQGAASVRSGVSQLSPSTARRLERILDIAEQQGLLPEGIDRARVAADIAAHQNPDAALRHLAGRVQSARSSAIDRLTVAQAADRARGDVGLKAVKGRASRVLYLPEYQEGIERASQAFERLPDIESKKNLARGTHGDSVTSGWKGSKIESTERAKAEGVKAGYETEEDFRDQGVRGQYESSHSERQVAAGTSDQHFASSKPLCPACQGWFRARAVFEGRAQFVADPSGVLVFTADGRLMRAPHPSGAVTMPSR